MNKLWKRKRFPSLQECDERLKELEKERSFWEQMKVVMLKLDPPADPPETKLPLLNEKT
jgi:hypothetical protein